MNHGRGSVVVTRKAVEKLSEKVSSKSRNLQSRVRFSPAALTLKVILFHLTTIKRIFYSHNAIDRGIKQTI